MANPSKEVVRYHVYVQTPDIENCDSLDEQLQEVDVILDYLLGKFVGTFSELAIMEGPNTLGSDGPREIAPIDYISVTTGYDNAIDKMTEIIEKLNSIYGGDSNDPEHFNHDARVPLEVPQLPHYGNILHWKYLTGGFVVLIAQVAQPNLQ